MQGLYKFELDCDRQGFVEGLFIADDSEVEAAMGQKIYISDALGKHGDVKFVLTQEMVVLKSTNPEVIKVIDDLDLWSGENPLLHIYKDCAVCGTFVYSGEDEWLVEADKEAWERSGRCVRCEPLKQVPFNELPVGTYFQAYEYDRLKTFCSTSAKVKADFKDKLVWV